MGADDLAVSLAFSLILLAASVAMLLWHVRSWRESQNQQLDDQEHDYRRRQFRRRMQTSAMLGVLGVAILVGHWITSPPLAWWVPLAFWAGTGFVGLWMGLLAVADMVLTQLHFRRLGDTYAVEQARLQAELRRLQHGRANGKAEE